MRNKNLVKSTLLL